MTDVSFSANNFKINETKTKLIYLKKNLNGTAS